MVYLSFINVKNIYWKTISHKLNVLSIDEQQKTLSFRSEKDRCLILSARLLLFQMLKKEFSYSRDQLDALKFDKLGKPYLEGIEEVEDISISHSGDIAICCISTKGKVGIDIELRKEYDFNDFDSALSTNELKKLRDNSSEVDFLEMWTIKEAILKVIGKGLLYDISKVDTILLTNSTIIIDDVPFYVKQVEINTDYSCSIASSEKDFETSILLENYFEQLFI